jgi:glycosyltransferase involved in cell wall biosynthesis
MNPISPAPGTKPRSVDRLWFAVPGDIDTRTGGTIYDKKVMAELRQLGWTVEHLEWPPSFPFPTTADIDIVTASLAACPDGALVMIDGLASGVLPEVTEEETARLRLVALVHHPLALESGLPKDVAQRFLISERRTLKHVRAIVVTSEVTAATLLSDFGVAAGTITVATPGIEKRGPLRTRIVNAAPQLLAVGTVMPRKGFDVLVDALAFIADLNWHCTIAGSLDRNPETAVAIQQQIDGHGLGGRIALIGEVDDPTAFYQTADIFVSSSRYEGYGMAIAEALAYGLPVVAARVGAIPDVVPDGAGILVPVDDPASLSDALRTLITDPMARQRYAKSATEAATRFASWRDTAERISSALHAVQ